MTSDERHEELGWVRWRLARLIDARRVDTLFDAEVVEWATLIAREAELLAAAA